LTQQVREETARALRAKRQIGRSRFLRCRRAFAIPITYLILFASLMALISLTYTFAVAKINGRAGLLRVSVAKQNMQILDDAVHSVGWSFGGSKVIYVDDCGGTFRTLTTAKKLMLNLTDEQTMKDVLFNSSLGEVFYELEHSESSDYGLYLRGDDRAIINKTSFTMTQLYITNGNETQNVILCYRPLATVAVIGTINGKPLNLIRISVVNLNSSQALGMSGSFYLRVMSTDVTTTSSQYQFNSSISSLALKATLDGVFERIWLPVSSTSEGAVVDVETVVCNVRLMRTEA
jgi:hypothetical protein